MEFDDLVKHLLKENWPKGTSKAPDGKSFKHPSGAPSNRDHKSDGNPKGGSLRRTRPPNAPSKKTHGEMEEDPEEDAEYRGRKVKLNKPTRGDVKKFKVYVKDPKSGNVKKVNFGHGGTSAKRKGEKTMKIRKSNPKARKSFRARHNCDNPGPKTKARYWSCRKW